MIKNSYPDGQKSLPDEEERRFSESYKRSMDQVTMSPELRERILRLQERKQQPRWLRRTIRIASPALCTAACLAVIFTARGWLSAESKSLTTETGESASAAAYSLSSQVADTAEEETETAEETGAGSAPDMGAAAAETKEELPAADDFVVSAPRSSSSDAEASAESNVSEPAADSEVSAPAEHSGYASRFPEESAFSGEGESGAGTEASAGETAESPAPAEMSELSGSSQPADEADFGINMMGLDDGEETAGGASSESGDTLQPSVAGASTPSTEMANPLVSYDTLADAEAVLGWSVTAPALDGSSLTLISGSLFEAEWPDGSYYRMAKTADWGENISGDYSTYPYSETKTFGSVSLELYGNAENAYMLLVWQDGVYSYAYSSPEAMTAEEAEAFVREALH